MLTLSCVDLIERLEAGTFDEFRHRDHVRAAWAYLERYDPAVALERLGAAIARLAASRGAPEKYHYTMTRAWLELVAEAKTRWPDADSADALMAACPALADSRSINRCYSAAALADPAARAHWRPPDLAPIAAALSEE